MVIKGLGDDTGESPFELFDLAAELKEIVIELSDIDVQDIVLDFLMGVLIEYLCFLERGHCLLELRKDLIDGFSHSLAFGTS